MRSERSASSTAGSTLPLAVEIGGSVRLISGDHPRHKCHQRAYEGPAGPGRYTVAGRSIADRTVLHGDHRCRDQLRTGATSSGASTDSVGTVLTGTLHRDGGSSTAV